MKLSIPLALALSAASAGAARAEGVLMLSGRSASEAQWETGLQTPHGQRLDLHTLVRRTRELAPLDHSPVLWFPASNRVLRLDELPAEQRVAYHCLAPDSERFAPGQALFRPVRAALDPAAWVVSGPGRVLWWPSVPQPDDCGLAAALLAAEPTDLDFGAVVLGAEVERELVLSNAGRVELDLGQLAVEPAAYSLRQDGCSQRRLLPGQGCELRLGFRPPAAEVYAGALLAPSTAMLGADRFVLTGQGMAPADLPDAVFASGFE